MHTEYFRIILLRTKKLGCFAVAFKTLGAPWFACFACVYKGLSIPSRFV